MFSMCLRVDASNKINSINMDIYIDEFGNAKVNEVWDAYLDSGTEGYRGFSNLENITISDFKVQDELGNMFSYQDNWNTSLDFSDKAYKNGINYTSDGLELCWGISEYGGKVYTLDYMINNLVVNYTDTQGIYFNLLNINQDVDKVSISISSYNGLSIDNSKIWGLGYDGTINFIDGKVVIDTSYLPSNKYVVLLVRFEDKYFNSSNYSDKSFDDVYDEAFYVPTYDTNYDYDYSSGNSFFEVFKVICMTIFFGVIVLINLFGLRIFDFRNKDKIRYKFEDGKKLPKIEEVDYYRDIPFNKDIVAMYFLMSICFNENENKLKKRLISSFIMKWILEGKLEFIDGKLVINEQYRKFSVRKRGDKINVETDLFNIFIKASGDDFVLESKEFSKWCKYYYGKLEYWYTRANIDGRNKFYGKFYAKNGVMVLKEELKLDAVKVLGLKKFLLEFGRMYDKSTIEVELWNYYLICAELFGIADKVREEMKTFYPEFYDVKMETVDFNYINDFVSKGYNSMDMACRANQVVITRSNSSGRDYSGSDFSSGGGGSSHSSGGSSSGGSSGGGFR